MIIAKNPNKSFIRSHFKNTKSYFHNIISFFRDIYIDCLVFVRYNITNLLKGVTKMKKETIVFATETKNGVVVRIGKSFITQPPIKFAGGSVKWFDDSQLIRRTTA